MTHEELIEELKEARRELFLTLQGLSEEEVGRPILGGDWSAKDVLAHVASWDELRCFEISRVARGDEPLYADLDEPDFASWNALLLPLRRGLPLGQVVRDMNQARRRVVESISETPEKRLAAVEVGRVRVRRAAAHDREHAAQLREWRQRTEAAVATRSED